MDWQPSATLDVIRTRANLYKQIRTFFAARDCLEVDTPLLATSTNPDVNIASIKAYNSQTKLYLQTSPEFAMKRLLAAGSGSIYQICHAFRAAEEGRQHRSEFTLLEWYRVGFDYHQLMDELIRLIDDLSGHKNTFLRVSYTDLFMQQVSIDIHSINLQQLQTQCLARVPGVNIRQLRFDECLDLLLSLVIAPNMRGYVFVSDYPLSQAALARISRKDIRVAERFELFHEGLELANGFSELTDAKQQRERFMDDNRQRRRNGLSEYPLDEHFLAALDSGLPNCAGVALGLDRLLMVLKKLDSINQVMTFGTTEQ